jgi:hypothetical protein
MSTRTPPEYDPTHAPDVSEFARKLAPETRARVLEIVRLTVDLQDEAAVIMAEESARLSATREEEEAARDLLGVWFIMLSGEALREEVELAQSKAS